MRRFFLSLINADGDAPHPARASWNAAVLAVMLGVALGFASMPFVAYLYPYHPHVRGAYTVALPLTAGYLIGLVAPDWAARRPFWLLAACAVVLGSGVAWRGETNLGPLTAVLVAASGVALTLLFVRLGLAHAGVPWSARGGPEHDRPERRTALIGFGVAWVWLLWVMFQPSEASTPTRWLLTVLGARPRISGSGPASISLARHALSASSIPHERGVVRSRGYRFSMGVVRARPAEILINASVRRDDGLPFGTPAWLTLDVDDAACPDPANDAVLFNRSWLAPADPGRDAVLGSSDARHLSAATFFGAGRSLGAVHVRARAWLLERVRPDGVAVFRPVAEADLGAWDLTVLRFFRRQPFRTGLNPGTAPPQG